MTISDLPEPGARIKDHVIAIFVRHQVDESLAIGIIQLSGLGHRAEQLLHHLQSLLTFFSFDNDSQKPRLLAELQHPARSILGLNFLREEREVHFSAFPVCLAFYFSKQILFFNSATLYNCDFRQLSGPGWFSDICLTSGSHDVASAFGSPAGSKQIATSRKRIMASDYYARRISIHGRKVGLTSTDGLYVTPGIGDSSTRTELVAEMSGPGWLETVSSSDATLRNYGISHISSAVLTGSALSVEQPVAGIRKRIAFSATSSEVTFSSTATSIKFNTRDSLGVGGGSTTITVASTSASLSGGSLEMFGLSSAAWQVGPNYGVAISS